jgi:large subunit ribosomal protein L5
MSELKEFYQKEVTKKLKEAFGYKNNFEIPKVEKVVINVGVGEAVGSQGALQKVEEQIAAICGQKPKIVKAKQSISAFKLRKGMPIGVCATLREKRMYDFLKKFFTIVLPRIRDFRGLSQKSFDKHGNYTIGLKEQTIFPEIDYSKVDKVRGMEITFTTSAKTKEEAQKLLEFLGMAFTKAQAFGSEAQARRGKP